MDCINVYNPKHDYEFELEHKNIRSLGPGVYVVQDYEEISARTKGALKKILDSGKLIHSVDTYGGDSDSCRLFTGSVVWTNTKQDHWAYETSAFGGNTMVYKNVPAGTLVIALDDD